MRPPEEDLKAEEAEGDEPEKGTNPAQALMTQVQDRIADTTVGFVKKSAEVLNSFIDVFVGLCFVGMGFMSIVVYRNYGLTVQYMDVMDWAILVATLFGGTLMIFNPRRTFNTSIGFYAIIMGIISFCSNWSSLGEIGNDPDSFFQIIYDIEFIATLVLLGFSLNLIVSGTSYLRGRPRGTLGMMAKAAFMMSVSLIMVVLSIRTGEFANIGDAFRKDPITLIQIFMFFIFLNMMDTDEARSYNTKNRLKLSTEALRHTKTLDETSFVMLGDAKALTDESFAGWERPNDGGPVEYEYVFAIESIGGGSYVTAQKWKGHDTFYLTITDHERGANIRATRIKANRMTLSEDLKTFEIQGSDHFNIRVNVRTPLEGYKISWTK